MSETYLRSLNLAGDERSGCHGLAWRMGMYLRYEDRFCELASERGQRIERRILKRKASLSLMERAKILERSFEWVERKLVMHLKGQDPTLDEFTIRRILRLPAIPMFVRHRKAPLAA